MKNTVIAACALFVVAQKAQGQTSFLPEIGANLANLSTGANDPVNSAIRYNNKTRFKAGISFKFPVGKGFFFQPGIFYSEKGAQTYYEMIRPTASNLSTTYNFDGNIKLNYFEVPVNIGYEHALGKSGYLFGTAGMYAAYVNEGSSSYPDGSYGVPWLREDEHIRFGDGGTIKHYDLGFNVSVGYRFPVPVFIRAQYGSSLINISNVQTVSYRNKGFSFTIGYEFKISAQPRPLKKKKIGKITRY